MASSRSIEPVYVFKDGHLSLSACFPWPGPDQLGLDGFEESLHGGVVVTIAFAAHRDPEPMLARDFLVVVRTILAAAVGVMDAALWWSPQGNGHVQGLDRQVAFHPVAGGCGEGQSTP